MALHYVEDRRLNNQLKIVAYVYITSSKLCALERLNVYWREAYHIFTIMITYLYSSSIASNLNIFKDVKLSS